MNRISRLRLLYVGMDWLTTSVAWLLFNVIRFITTSDIYEFSKFYSLPQVWGGQILFPLLMIGLYWLSGYYNNPRERSRVQDFLSTFSSVLIGSLVIFFLAVVNDIQFRRRDAIELVGALFCLLFLSVYFGRAIITACMVRNVRRHRDFRAVVMVGDDEQARHLAESINNMHRGMGLKVVAFANPATDDPAEICNAHNSHMVIISPNLMRTPDGVYDLFGKLLPADITILLSPGIYDFHTSAGRIGNITAEPLIDITHPRISDSTVNLKRAMDVVVSSFALVVLSPLLLALAIAVKTGSPGPVIYRQKRVGRLKREFTILKFRTMRENAESQSGPALTQTDDPRITRVGKWMRRYRLDELPQFWNVLRGDMSLVGPRPERQVFAEMVAAHTPLYSLIYQVRPGITSWGMVNYGYASTVEEMVERLRYDLIYIENISLSTDLKILLHTVSTVLSGRGK